MDPGLQLYGSTLFKRVSEAGGEMFLQLPPPVPSKAQYIPVAVSNNTNTSAAPAAPDMTAYYGGSGGGCFGADSTVVVMTAIENRTKDGITAVS